jgi:hypothetical protein
MAIIVDNPMASPSVAAPTRPKPNCRAASIRPVTPAALVETATKAATAASLPARQRSRRARALVSSERGERLDETMNSVSAG